MRIGIEAQRIFRPKRHGMDIVALETIKALQKEDLKNEYFIFVKANSDSGVLKETANFKIVVIPSVPYPVWEQILLPRFAKKFRLDILHCTSNTAPLFCSTPLVLTLHDIIYLEKLDFSLGTWYQRLGNLYRKWVVPAIVNNCQKIITVSNFEKELIQAHFKFSNKNKLVAIHNAAGSHFNDEISAEELVLVKTKYKLPESFVFFLGNTDPKKNVTGVMQALQAIKVMGKLNFTLVMPDYNYKHLKEVLIQIDALDLLENIQLTGYINNLDLPAIYKQADLFLYPSLRESFGIPILEAMACGTPVLTSNKASMPEVAAGAAFFCNPIDSFDIALNWLTALTDLGMQNEKRRQGMERAKLFSWDATARQVLDVYAEME